MASAALRSARLPVRVRLALFAPLTVTPGGVADSDRVPFCTVRVTCRVRSAAFGSRLASMSATEMPAIGSGTSSRPFWVPGRVFTGASFCST
ncbi:hypothetical protein D9M71_262300 [compost metagenome]